MSNEVLSTRLLDLFSIANGCPVLGGLRTYDSVYLIEPTESPDCVSKELLEQNSKPVEVTYDVILYEEDGGGGEVIVLSDATFSDGNIELTYDKYVHNYGGVEHIRTLPIENFDISTIPINYDSHHVCNDRIDQSNNRFNTCEIVTKDGLRFVYDGLMRRIFMYDNGTYIRAFGKDCDLFNPILFFQHTDGSIFILNNEESREGDYSDETLYTKRNIVRFFLN